MQTSSFEAQIHVKATSVDTWCIFIKVFVNNEPVPFQQSVSSHQIISSNPDISVEFLGLCDLLTAVYEVHGSISDLSVPLSVSVIPRYDTNAAMMYQLDSDLADLVGREFLAHPKYALTCIHSYVRRNNLYAGKSIMCDDTLQKIFSRVGVRLESVWPVLSQKMKMREVEQIRMKIELTDLDKTYSQNVVVKCSDDGVMFPSFYKTSANTVKKIQSLNLKQQTKQTKRSFKRNKSIEI